MNKQVNYNAPHWDVFCAVVDNYGDIGVTWRLAKQLHAEYGITINLWVDDLKSFSHILPKLDPLASIQCFYGVNIYQWNQPLDINFIPGELLIEAFACELPSQVIEVIESQHQAYKQSNGHAIAPPTWINLEYLSAEDWVNGCHGLPSMQPSGIKKHFYFPGFTRESGGLICESSLFDERDQWQSDVSNKMALFSQLNLKGIESSDTVISVFSYESTALTQLCKHWTKGTFDQTSDVITPIHALIPKGKSLSSLASFLDIPIDSINSGQSFTVDHLTIHVLPMTDQTQFDRLLWSCDLNIVRGEDSFLRAQWAAKPFIWHIYPQEDDYHLVKLQAFVNIYIQKLDDDIATNWSKTNFAFNQQDADVVKHWQKLISAQLPLLQHAKQWAIDAKTGADLASRLVQFVKTS